MAVHFISGRAGAGKTHACLRAIQEELRRDETRRLIFLVPEQAALQTERALAAGAPGGGYWRADVLGFAQLARRVAGESRPEPPLLRAGARAMVLRRVLEERLAEGPGEAAAAPEVAIGARERTLGARVVDVFGAATRTAGFYVELDRLIEELLSENVHPGDLLAAAARLPDGATRRKIEVIADTYAAYLDGVGEARLDAAARLALLRARLVEAPWLADASIWVDGFAGFTGQELATLSALAAGAREMFITLLTDAGGTPEAASADGLFQRVAHTYRVLRERFEADGVEIGAPLVMGGEASPRFARAPDLAELERRLATAPKGGEAPRGAPEPAAADGRAAQPLASSPCVEIVRAPTHRDEATLAARHIRQRVAEGGWEYRDFAVIARDVAPLADVIADVFDEYEIPYFLDRRRELRGLPAARLLEALLAAAAHDLPPRAMSRVIRTGLAPLRRREAEAIERMVLRHNVRGQRRWLMPTWDFADDRTGRTDGRAHVNDSGDARRGRTPDEARLELARGLAPLLELARVGRAPAREWAAAIAQVLESWGVRRRMGKWISRALTDGDREQAETHRLSWEACCEVLDDLAECLGETRLDALEVRGVVAGALSERTLGIAPPMLDQVLVSSIERSRHPEVRDAWVLAFNDGVFPADPADDMVLTREEREALRAAGLERVRSARDAVEDEALLAYIAFTRPSEHLTISFATEDERGAALLPSPLLEDVLDALPHVQVVDAPTDAEPLTLREAVRGWLAPVRPGGGDEAGRRRTRHERLVRSLETDATVGGLVRRLVRGRAYSNIPAALSDGETSSAKRDWRASTSELATYVDCPFRYFAAHRLKLRDSADRVPLAQRMGVAAHQILACVVREAARCEGGAAGLSEERWGELLDDAFEAYRGRHDADFEARQPRDAFMERRLREILGEVVAAHATLYRACGLSPMHVERDFDLDDPAALPALELGDGRTSLRLHGRIDRVDAVEVRSKRWLLVTDYKPRAALLRQSALIRSELQLLAYALAVEQGGASGERGDELAGVLLAPLRADAGMLSRTTLAAVADAAKPSHLYRLRGWMRRELLDGYGPRRADKPPMLQVVSPLSEVELARRKAAVRRIGLAAAAGHADGSVAIAPLRDGPRMVCAACPFGAVCRYDPAYNRPREAGAELAVADSTDEAGGRSGESEAGA